jgi:hypothetical protein
MSGSSAAARSGSRGRDRPASWPCQSRPHRASTNARREHPPPPRPRPSPRSEPIAGPQLARRADTRDGRVYQRPLPGSVPALQAANFTLPRASDDVGSTAVRRMRAGSVRFGLLEVGKPAGPRFHPARLPLQIERGDFGSPFEGAPLEHAFAIKHGRVVGRAFVLRADFTIRPVSPRCSRRGTACSPP